MKRVIVKITFKDGSVGYYKSKECITAFKDAAKVFGGEYAKGLVEGLNFAIECYEDVLTEKAEIEEL